MGFLAFPGIILLIAIIWRLQKLQDDIEAVKAQNERIIKALHEEAIRPTNPVDNPGEDIL